MLRFKAFLTVASIALCTFSHAQVARSTDGTSIFSKKMESEKATGSQYVTEKFLAAKISTDSQIEFLRYNGFTDLFEKKPNADAETGVTINPEYDTAIIFTGSSKKYVYVDYTSEKGEKMTGYLNVISDNGKVKIYARERVIKEAEVFPSNSYQTYKAANFKKVDPVFYIDLGNSMIVEMPTNRKEFSKQFGPREKDVLTFIKSNKVDLENTQNLLELSNFLNTLS